MAAFRLQAYVLLSLQDYAQVATIGVAPDRDKASFLV